MPQVTIVTRRSRQSFQVRKGLGLQAVSAQHPEAPLEFDCREADCGICLVTVLEGGENLTPMTADEKDFLQAMRARPEERLACQCRVTGDVTIEVPEA